MKRTLTAMLFFGLVGPAQANVYGISSGADQSSASFGYTGHAAETELETPDQTEVFDADVTVIGGQVYPSRSELYCGWNAAGCAFVIDDPVFGLIVVQTPAIPGGLPGPATHAPPAYPFDPHAPQPMMRAPKRLAPHLQSLGRPGRSILRERHYGTP